MTSEALFVWIYLPEQTAPVVAGRLELARTQAGVVGRFVYGKSYLGRADAVPLDPVALPLKAGEQTFTALSGFPGVILDACPDRWGIKVIDRMEGSKDYPQGYILMNDPGRSGNLAFSRSPLAHPVELASREYPLRDLLFAAEAVEADEPVDPELLKALHPGTGGARPKCNVVDEEGVWIAKFPSIEDDPAISEPRLEHAVLRLGRACGLNTAESRILSVEGRDVCLVRRFDREVRDGTVLRKGFLSARTVFYADPGYAALATGSYARLARWSARYGCTEADRREIFRRMVFNCVVRNTDDHELNHGLVHSAGVSFRLAPAFDVVPSLGVRRIYHHALLISDSAAGTVENLVGSAGAFGLSRDEALNEIDTIQGRALDAWPEVFYEAGFGDEDLRRVEHLFRPLPARAEAAPGIGYL